MIKKVPLLAFAVLTGWSISAVFAESVGPAATPVPMQVPPPVTSLPPLPVPPLRPILQPLAHRDIAEIRRLTPRVEIWRPNSTRPQIPARRSDRGNMETAFATGTEPITIRLQFDPRSAGEKVTVVAAQGISLDPPAQILTVSTRGDCTFSAQLAEGASRGHILIRCKMVRTVVPMTRASLTTVQAEETRTGGRP
jgi:hypothetical protein